MLYCLAYPQQDMGKKSEKEKIENPFNTFAFMTVNAFPSESRGKKKKDD